MKIWMIWVCTIRRFKKTIERPKDGYSAKAEMRTFLPHFILLNYSVVLVSQPRNIYVSLGHLSVEKEMRIIESAITEDLPETTRRDVIQLVKHRRAMQLKQETHKGSSFRFVTILKRGLFTILKSTL